MNKIVLSLGLLLLVSSCGDNPLGIDWPESETENGDTWVIHTDSIYLNYDGALNDCNYAENPNHSLYYGNNGITTYDVCCCNSEASNYSEDGWNCNPEDDTYCIFE